jgi:hypothetical protein
MLKSKVTAIQPQTVWVIRSRTLWIWRLNSSGVELWSRVRKSEARLLIVLLGGQILELPFPMFKMALANAVSTNHWVPHFWSATRCTF